MIKKVPLTQAIINVNEVLVTFVDDVPKGFYDEDPWDDQMSNALRAVRAAKVVEHYANEQGQITPDEDFREDLGTVVQDLLTDIVHFCDGHALGFQEILERAESMYAEECEVVRDARQHEKKGDL